MIGLFGNITLALALIFALLQFTLPLVGQYKKCHRLTATARPLAFGQASFVFIAYALLTIAFVNNDFSLVYVAQNSHPDLPLMYRATAVWGAHEGSILLWAVMLNGWGLIYACTQNNRTVATTLSMFGLINALFLGFLLLTSSPFISATTNLAGRDLNPLLQDPGFVIHPPMLYAGYVGFSAAFAITLAAMLTGELNSAWARVTKYFAVGAWIFLTFGITLGSWWAYRVLGWGGFWFWDPVENASLLPWLAGTALIHVLIVTEKRELFAKWSAFLAILTFALSMLGTFLVRSGVLISAHTFASDPKRGLFLLAILAVLTTAALFIFIVRGQFHAVNSRTKNSLISRETGLLINSLLLFVAVLTVLLGTVYPLVLQALNQDTISVGAPYFNSVMAPLAIVTMAFMGIGPLLRWQKQPLSKLWRQSKYKLATSLIAAIIVIYFFTQSFSISALIALFLSFWIIQSVYPARKIHPAMTLAHVGFAICMIGILLSSLLSQENDVRMKPGETTNIGPYQFLFIDTAGLQGPNYRGIRGAFEVTRNGRHIINLYPEKRIYTVRQMIMTNVDIDAGLFRDLYIALGEPLENNDWTIRFYYKPFIRWIWLGGLIMMGGGIASITRKNHAN